tara:strand:- start:231 stop:641 length:411 start_codon:yes stop_codon:yes gene_type:complete
LNESNVSNGSNVSNYSNDNDSNNSRKNNYLVNNSKNNISDYSITKVDNNILPKSKTKKKIGKNKHTNTIKLLLKNDKITNKNFNIYTIKKKLKRNNLIKYGSNAPTKLLKDIYYNSTYCGEVMNINNDVLIHNFDK